MKKALTRCRRALPIRRLVTLIVFIIFGAAVAGAQAPTPTPPDRRDLGIESSPSNVPSTDQTHSKEAKPELVLQTGYNSFFGATRLVFSPDGRLLATAALQQLGAIKGHSKGVTDVVFSRDGKFLASSGTDNTIKIWDVASKRELRTLTGHTAHIESMDFSPDGRRLASASEQSTGPDL